MQAMNARSSRSHTVFQIIIEQKQKLGGNVDGLQVGAWSCPQVPLEYPIRKYPLSAPEYLLSAP